MTAHPITGFECVRCLQPITTKVYWCAKCKSRYCPSCYHAFCPTCKHPVTGPHILQG